MPSPAELDDLDAAIAAENAYRSQFGGSMLDEPVDLRPEAVGVGSMRKTQAAPATDIAYPKPPATPTYTDQVTPRKNEEMRNELMSNPGSAFALGLGSGVPGALGHIGDTLAATPPGMAMLYGANKLLGSKNEGMFGDEIAAGKTFLKPFANLIPKTPDAKGETQFGGPIDEHGTLQGQRAEMLGERAATAMDPQASFKDRAVSGGLAALDALALLSAGPRSAVALPGIGAPIHDAASGVMGAASKAARAAEGAGINNPTVGEAIGGLASSLKPEFGRGINFPSSGDPVRRGAIDLGPGPLRPRDEQYKRIVDAADEIAGVKNHLSLNIPQKKADKLLAMLSPVENDEAEFARYATMTDTELRQALRDNARMGSQAERRATPTGRAEDIGGLAASKAASEGADVGETLGLSPAAIAELESVGTPAVEAASPASRARRGITPEEAAMISGRVKAQIKTGGGPQLESDLGQLTEKAARQAVRDLGGQSAWNSTKAENVAKLREMAQSGVARDATPSVPPTNPLNRQIAEEADAAAAAKQAYNDVYVSEPSPKSAGVEQPVQPTQGAPNGEVNVDPRLASVEPTAQGNQEVPAQNAAQVDAQGQEVRPGLLTDQAPGGTLAADVAPPPSPNAPGGGGPTVPALYRAPSGPSGPTAIERRSAPPPAKQPPLVGEWSPGGPEPPKTTTYDVPSVRAERRETGFAMNHVDKLENASRRAGSVVGRQLAEQGREIIHYGESRAARPVREYNAAQEAVLKSPSAREEATELFTPAAWKEAGAGDLMVGRFQAAVDGNAPLMGITTEERALSTPEAQDLARQYVKAMKETGDEAESLGVQTARGRDFKAKQGERWIQQIDPDAYSWLKEGDPTFDKLNTLLGRIYPDAEANAIGEALKSMTAAPLDRPSAFEFERLLKMMPAAIKDDAGQWRPILRYSPVATSLNTEGNITQLIRSQWMRLGGIKHLGQDVTKAVAEGSDANGILTSTKLGPALQAGGPEVAKAAEGMLAAIYRRPEAGYVGANPAKWEMNTSRSIFNQALRGVMGRIVPMLNLSRQSVVSSSQTLLEVPAMTGALNYAKAVAKTALRNGEASEEAKLAGALHEKFLMAASDVYDRHRLTESVLAANANRFPTERLNDFVKDFHDTTAFTAGKFKAEEMLAKGATKSDHLLMDEMNIPQSVQDVFRNPEAFTEQERLDASRSFGRSVQTETQIHSRNPALKGSFENDAVLRYVLPYLSYGINTAKRTFKDVERIWRMSAEGVDQNANFFMRGLQRLNPFGDAKQGFRNAVERAVTRAVGAEVAGEVVADLSSAFQGKDPLRRDRGKLARFLENLSYIGMLGPAHFLVDILSSNFMQGEDKKLFEGAHAGSRALELNNPLMGAAVKGATKLAKGDFAGAAKAATVDMAPAAAGIGRLTGLMGPVGEHGTKARAKKPHPFLDAPKSGTHPFLGGGSGKKHPFLEGGKASDKHPFLK